MLTQYIKQSAGDNDTFNGDNFIFSRVESKKVYTNGVWSIEGYKALADTDTGHVYSIVKDTYYPIDNNVITENMAQLINQKGLNPNITAYEYNHGSAMAVRYQFKEKGRDIQQGPNTTKKTFLCPEIWAYNSYDGSQTARLTGAVYDSACENGIAFKSTINFYKLKHTKNNADMAYIVGCDLDSYFDRLNHQIDVLESWANIEINYSDTVRLLEKIKGVSFLDRAKPAKRQAEKIGDKIHHQVYGEVRERGLEKINLWSIVSAVTNYSTLRNDKGLNGHGISTSSLNVGVSRQENVASWLTNIVAPFAENRLAGGLV
jgi:hypothetical protein